MKFEKENLYIVQDIPVFYYTPFEHIQGMLNHLRGEDVVNLYNSIQPCTCGSTPQCIQTECMGDFDFEIFCENPDCNRYVRRSMYDYAVRHGDKDEIDLAIQEWNDGITQEKIDAQEAADWEELRLKEHCMIWKPLYPNNMPENGQEGIYCLLFRKDKDKFCGCKWTVMFQKKELSPGCTAMNGEIESYILFHKRYFDLDDIFNYPTPSQEFGDNMRVDKETHLCYYEDDNSNKIPDSVNDYGDFVRAYNNLDDAKTGALSRCGWQQLNMQTIILSEKHTE